MARPPAWPAPAPWPPPASWPAPVPVPAGPPAGARYPDLLRGPRASWWRPLAGLALAALTWLGAATAVFLVSLAPALFVPGPTREALVGDLASEEPSVKPLGLLGLNLSLAVVIVAVVVAVLAVHRGPVGVLHSVLGRLRWRWLGACTGVALAAIVVNTVLWAVLPAEAGEAAAGRGPDTVALLLLLLVVLATTPLQSAGEEYAFRGYLSQAIGVWFRWPVVPALVSGALFAFAHGAQDPWLWLDRFAFGLTASWAAWRTGGLEAPIAFHAVNNLLAIGIAVAAGDLDASLTVSDLPWPLFLADVVTFLVFAGLLELATRRARVAVVSPRG